MANITSAKKRIRQDIKRQQRNIERRNRVRTFVRKLEVAIARNDDVAVLRPLFISAQSELFKGVSKGVIDSNAASRKVARLNARMKALVA